MIREAVRGVENWVDRHFIGFTVSFLFLLFIVLYFARNIFITIPAGNGGALWLRFFGGTVYSFTYGEGTKVIFPWDKIYVYDLRVQQETDEFDVLTKEGLQISVNVTLRFRLNPRALGIITSYAGENFVRTLILPSVGATVRKVASNYSSEEIYSTRRHEIETQILKELVQVVDDLIDNTYFNEPEIFVEDFWFRSITLPRNLQASIEAKLTQAQIAEQYVYILQREEREKERKQIEAQGIKAFQDTVSSGISENYLRWKGIDATLKLAESNNSKIVIIGGKEGLPIILGPMDGSNAGPGAVPPGTSGTSMLDRSLRRAPPAEPPGAPRSDRSSGSEEMLIGPPMPVNPLALDTKLSLPPVQIVPTTGIQPLIENKK